MSHEFDARLGVLAVLGLWALYAAMLVAAWGMVA